MLPICCWGSVLLLIVEYHFVTIFKISTTKPKFTFRKFEERGPGIVLVPADKAANTVVVTWSFKKCITLTP